QLCSRKLQECGSGQEERLPRGRRLVPQRQFEARAGHVSAPRRPAPRPCPRAGTRPDQVDPPRIKDARTGPKGLPHETDDLVPLRFWLDKSVTHCAVQPPSTNSAPPV